VAPIPPDQTCTTTTTFPGYCQPKATTCASNTDCPMDFTCTAVPSPNTSGPVSGGTAGTSGTATPETKAPAGDAFVPPPAGVPVPTTMVCASPFGYGIGRAAEDSTGGTPTATGGPGQNGGSAGTGGSLPPMSPTPTHETAGTGTSMPTSGCAVGGGSSSLALAALALLGLVIARRRR
jgi:MYXO-CTERM domain-containing protein